MLLIAHEDVLVFSAEAAPAADAAGEGGRAGDDRAAS